MSQKSKTIELLTEIRDILKERVIVFVPPTEGITMEEGTTTSEDLSNVPDTEVEVKYTTETKEGAGEIEDLVPEGKEIVYDDEE
tara:strand:- start:2782 stop:3033 length:252 start_codon:yes stop_codon:yes gene_type:complete